MKSFLIVVIFFILGKAQAQTMDFDTSSSVSKDKSEMIKPLSREQVDSEKIKDLGILTPSDVLEDSSQIQVIGSSVYGQTRSISIRGAPSSYTSIFWNGVKLNDWLAPSANAEGSQGGKEFSGQVLIIKGPQTLRRSSSAVAGMIEYKFDPDDRYLQLSGTDQNIHRESFEYLAEDQNGITGVGGSFYQSDYGSAFDRQKLNVQQRDLDLEKDRFQQGSISFLRSYRWSNGNRIQLLLHQQIAESSDDSGSFDDPNSVTARKNQIASGQFDFSVGNWQSTLRWDHQINRISFENPSDRFDQTRSETSNEGTSNRLQWGIEQEWRHTDGRHGLSLGVENIKENGLFFENSFGQKSQFQREFELSEAFGIHEVEWKSFDFSYGLRTSGKSTALQSQIQYHFSNGVSPYFIASRGYKDPSLYQLYSAYGDQHLKSEGSRSLESGFQYRTSAGDEFQIGLFRYDFENLITFNSGSMKYENIQRAKSEGLEVLAALEPWKLSEFNFLKWEGSYQRVESVNLDTQQRTVRIPQNSAKILLQHNPEQRLTTSLTVRYIGEREDFDGSNKKTLPKVTLFHLASRWKVDLKNEVSLRVENAGNQPYEEVWGYTPTGRIFILTYRRVL